MSMLCMDTGNCHLKLSRSQLVSRAGLKGGREGHSYEFGFHLGLWGRGLRGSRNLGEAPPPLNEGQSKTNAVFLFRHQVSELGCRDLPDIFICVQIVEATVQLFSLSYIRRMGILSIINFTISFGYVHMD